MKNKMHHVKAKEYVNIMKTEIFIESQMSKETEMFTIFKKSLGFI